MLARPQSAPLWFASYIQTYLERDVRSISAVQDLALFRRFLALVASRHGQVLNKTDLSTPLGMSVPGVTRWLDIREATGQILIVPPYFENLGKRLIKSPKVYIADSGLACHLLGIRGAAELATSPFLGAVFEGLVAAEHSKVQVHAGKRRELNFFRDHQGLQVDFLVPTGGGGVALIEAKASTTPMPDMARPMQRVASAWQAGSTVRGKISMFVVHRPSRGGGSLRAISPGATALPWRELAGAIFA